MPPDRAAFAGQLSDLPVGELLQTIATGKQTGVARFETNLGSATVWFRAGTLVDADMGRFHMEAAVRRLLRVDEGSFEVEFRPVSRRQLITQSTESLLAGETPSATVPAPGQQATPGKAVRGRPSAPWNPTGARRPIDSDPPTTPAAPAPTPAAPPSTAPAGQRVELGTLAGRASTRETTAGTSYEIQPGAEASAARTGATVRPPGDRDDLIATGQTLVPTGGPNKADPPKPFVPPPLPSASGASRNASATWDSKSEPNAVRRKTQGLALKLAKAAASRPKPSAAAPKPKPAAPAPVSDSAKTNARYIMPAEEKTTARPAPRTAEPGAPVAAPSEDPSGAISVGMVFNAPAGGKTLAPGASISAPEAEPVDQSRTAAYPALPQEFLKPRRQGKRPGRRARADSIAARIGLAPGASTPAGSLGTQPPATPAPPPVPGDTEETPTAEAPAPATVGRYEVLLRIARGGMGTVYLCRVTGEGGFRRLFALKVIRDHLSRNQEYVGMLLQEARIASRLHHPNVVGIVDIGMLQGQHYLVMDYVEGCTFSELLKVHTKSRPPHLILPILIDALTGLHAAHALTDDDGSALAMVHCDFSPQNMLVGVNGICQITDFGIAKAANALQDRASVTRGKPAYLSPEQIRGSQVDHRADIFAAGIVLWNALTGEQLFSGGSPDEVLRNVLSRDIPLPSTVGLRPPSCLDAVVLKALERDPGRRYQTAEDMLIALRRVAIQEDLLAPPSDVAKWVSDTFGGQLEMRRQAAGMGGPKATPGAPSSPISIAHTPTPTPSPISVSVPELGLGPDESATHALVHGAGDASAAGESRTVMLRHGLAPRPQDDLGKRARMGIIGAAAALSVAAVGIALARPEWLEGGFMDEHGSYVDMSPVGVPTEPLDIEPKPDGNKGKTGKTGTASADGKAPDEGKQEPPAESGAEPGEAPGSDPASESDTAAAADSGSDPTAESGEGPPGESGDEPTPEVGSDPTPPGKPESESKPKPKPKPKKRPKADKKPKKPAPAKPEPKPTDDPGPTTDEPRDPPPPAGDDTSSASDEPPPPPDPKTPPPPPDPTPEPEPAADPKAWPD